MPSTVLDAETEGCSAGAHQLRPGKFQGWISHGVGNQHRSLFCVQWAATGDMQLETDVTCYMFLNITQAAVQEMNFEEQEQR